MVAGGIRLPKSFLLVLNFLTNSSESQGVSQQQILRATGLSERAVKYAVKELKIKGLIFEIALIGDMRRRQYKMEG